MALIKTTRRGRTVYIVRWNYRDLTIDGKPYDSKEFNKRAAAKEFERTVTRGTSTSMLRTTIRDIALKWEIEHVATLSKWTQRTYRSDIKHRFCRGPLGLKKAETLTVHDIAVWMRWILQEGAVNKRGEYVPASPAVANKSRRTLKAMMRWARGQGLTTNRVVDDSHALRHQSTHRARAYTPTEINKLVQACPLLIDATLIQTACFSGLRRGELFALCWEQVDLERGTIRVDRALDVDRSIKPFAKTVAGNRTVGLFGPAITALNLWQQSAPDTQLVFPDHRGQPLGDTWLHNDLKDIRLRSGVHFQFQEARDTYASLLIATGENAMSLMLALGHANIQTTMRHYADMLQHSGESLATRASDRLAELGY